MPVSISEAQSKALKSGFLDGVGEGRELFAIVNGVFEQYGVEFLKNLGIYANKKKVVASGELLKRSKFRITDGTKMEIIMPDYFDYPNEGVRGVKSSKNAPGSPYRFKSYGMNTEGRAAIKKYIQSGHAKINTVRRSNDKALGIGREKKQLSLIDVKTNTLIYLIKKYGIKKTNYFTDALNATFKDFEVKMAEALDRDIVFSIEKLNRK